jgi:hypothetical protein
MKPIIGALRGRGASPKQSEAFTDIERAAILYGAGGDPDRS